jgi:thiamine pyrophosphate-dependent acetolactate synthase large subunit-like protein
MMTRREALQALSEFRTDEVVLGAMTAWQEWATISKHDLDMSTAGAMGQGPDIGLGIALARPDRKVIVLNGDGSMLMNLGSLVTIAHAAPANLILMVVQNSCYEITGGQPLPGLGKFSFVDLARASGINQVYEFEELEDLRAGIPSVLHAEGPAFVTLKVKPNPIPPAPRINMVEAINRVRANLSAPMARPVSR